MEARLDPNVEKLFMETLHLQCFEQQCMTLYNPEIKMQKCFKYVNQFQSYITIVKQVMF